MRIANYFPKWWWGGEAFVHEIVHTSGSLCDTASSQGLGPICRARMSTIEPLAEFEVPESSQQSSGVLNFILSKLGRHRNGSKGGPAVSGESQLLCYLSKITALEVPKQRWHSLLHLGDKLSRSVSRWQSQGHQSAVC